MGSIRIASFQRTLRRLGGGVGKWRLSTSSSRHRQRASTRFRLARPLTRIVWLAP